jgi:hypothetical protein
MHPKPELNSSNPRNYSKATTGHLDLLSWLLVRWNIKGCCKSLAVVQIFQHIICCDYLLNELKAVPFLSSQIT